MLATGWAYIRWNGVYDWYYFGELGNMLTGWITVGGHTYYLQETPDGYRGRMLVGWQMIDGKWYFFNTVSDGTKGALLKNTVTSDGYHVGEEGESGFHNL